MMNIIHVVKDAQTVHMVVCNQNMYLPSIEVNKKLVIVIVSCNNN